MAGRGRVGTPWPTMSGLRGQLGVTPTTMQSQITTMCRLTSQAKSTLSARQTCILAFWAVKAGRKEELLESLALQPGCQTGKFSRNFDDACGTKPDAARVYQLPMAIRRRHDPSRSWSDVPTLLPLEKLCDEISSSMALPEMTPFNSQFPPDLGKTNLKVMGLYESSLDFDW